MLSMRSQSKSASLAQRFGALVLRILSTRPATLQALVLRQVWRTGGNVKQIRWEALFEDGWKEVSVEDLLFRLIGSGLIRAYREKR
jgi:hypothetical protein